LVSAPVRRFFRHPPAVIGLVVFVLLLLLAFAGPHLWRYSYTDYTDAYSQSPSAAHPFGTDSSGRDLFAEVLRGTSRSMEIALLVAVVSTVLGALVGAVAGYYRGAADSGLMRLVDLVLTLPIYAVAALLGHQVGGGSHGWISLGLVLAFLLWAPIARMVRGVTLSLRQQDFIEASRALGASDRWIIVRHILPNASGVIIVNATLCVAVAVLAETALSYVGFGVRPPDVSLGSLVADAQAASTTRSWLFYYPGAVLVLLVLAVNFIGDGLQDALDPSGDRRVARRPR
jgi:ABC-type dipeptide/oligopeptide/nickel transport system permease subunit